MKNRRSIRYAELRSSVSVEKSVQGQEQLQSSVSASSLSTSPVLLLRYETLEGRKHLVVPAVMLVGDSVIWPANAPSKEYVPMDCLERSHLVAFNGRPIVPRHPQRDGEFVSANDPEMFTSERTGVVFFTRLNGKNLGCEMWFDVDKSISLGGDAELAIKKLESGETINISTGVYFEAEEVEREINGETVGAIWIEIWPDHLATLPNTDGACDLSMGCGTPRVAAGNQHSQKSDNILDVNGNNNKELAMGALGKNENEDKNNNNKDNQSLLSRLLETFSQPFRASLVFDDGDSDEDLRSMLRKAMREIDKSFDCILPVYPENQAFIYMTYTIAGGDYSGTIKYFRRTYELASDGKSVTINDDAVEVRMKEVWETVSGEEIEETNEEIIVSEKNNKRDGTCTCGNGNRQNQQQRGVDPEPVSTVSDPLTITEEMALEALPDLKAIVTEYRTMQASRKDALVTQLLSVQTVYDEKALREKDVKQLEDIAALVGQKVTSPDPIDYSLRGNSLPDLPKEKEKALSNQKRKLPDPWNLNKEANKAN